MVLKSCLKESSLSFPEKKLDDLTMALFESADSDNSGSITFEELRRELQRFPEIMENLTIRYFQYNQQQSFLLKNISCSVPAQFY